MMVAEPIIEIQEVQLDVRLPRWTKVLFKPARFKVPHGGRGAGAKSWSVARALLLLAADRPLRILCTRETMESIKESVHAELVSQIKKLGLQGFYKVARTEITGRNGSQFLFSGLRVDPDHIKSFSDVDIVWVEEAHNVSEQSWRVLIPTVRKPGSEIWVTFNPRHPEDPTSQRFLENARPDMVVIPLRPGKLDNPYFTAEMQAEMDYDFKVDPETAEHVWGGAYERHSDAQIFKGKCRVEAFEVPYLDSKTGEPWSPGMVKTRTSYPVPKWHGPYLGADFGFSTDPATLVQLWIDDELPRLYVEYEFYEVGCPLSKLGKKYEEAVPGCKKHTIRGDASRPETIFHMREAGFDMVAAKKWAGSVEDGIEWLKSFEVITIHPRCIHAEQESRLYKFKVDKLTGKVTSIIVDAWNHIWDAIRYGLQPIISPDEEDVHQVSQIEVQPINSALDAMDRGR